AQPLVLGFLLRDRVVPDDFVTHRLQQRGRRSRYHGIDERRVIEPLKLPVLREQRDAFLTFQRGIGHGDFHAGVVTFSATVRLSRWALARKNASATGPVATRPRRLAFNPANRQGRTPAFTCAKKLNGPTRGARGRPGTRSHRGRGSSKCREQPAGGRRADRSWRPVWIRR